MQEIDKAINKIEKGDAWEDTDEIIELEVKKPLKIVVPVRLSADDWERLRNEAGALGIGPTTLVRMWVLEKLRSLYATERRDRKSVV
jgi:hypothetical protein